MDKPSKTSANEEMLRQERAQKGIVPVRKHDLLPTNKDAVLQTNININHSPHIEQQVWKSKNWRGFVQWFPWTTGSFFVFVGTVILGNPDDIRYSPLFFFIATLSFLSSLPLKRWAKTLVRLGFDWNLNIFWMKKASCPNIVWEPDANLIISFDSIPYELQPSGRFFTGEAYFPAMRGDIVYTLSLIRSGSPHPWLLPQFIFATEKEGVEIKNKLNKLLESQL